MVSGINGSALLSSYLASQGLENGGSAGPAVARAPQAALPQAALARAATTSKASSAAQTLEAAQKTLGRELRTALEKGGTPLRAAVEFSVKSDGTVDVRGSAADQATVKTFLKSDTSQPGFATRIATQARDALKLSSGIQQSAAISQAARLAKSAAGVMSLYQSLMQNAGATSVVFSVSPTASTLTYPGSLTANA